MDYRKFKIYSERNGNSDLFYAAVPCGERYYLFSSRHSKSVCDFFKNGVHYNKATDFTVAKRNCRICSVMERIPPAVRYISKEYMLA